MEKRSWVWKYFDLTPDKAKAKCKLCPAILAYKGTTSNIGNHLKAKHPVTSSDNLEPSSKGEKRQQQSTLQFGIKKPKSRANWQKITTSLVEMCALDLRPLSIVNGVGFQRFVCNLDPSYDIPCHTTIKNYTNLYYGSLKDRLKEELKLQSTLAFTTDTWTSCATEGYLTLTVHFINDEWVLKNFVLATTEVKDHHTGENLAAAILDVCKDFGLSDVPVAGIATDNASNMVTMTRALKWPHIRCFAHTLQLSVKAGLKISAIHTATIAGRKLVGHFKKSTLASNDLKARQEQLKLPMHSLLQDVATRWNSTYFMFERLLEQRLAIFAVLHNPSVTAPSDARVFELSDQVWRTIEEMVPVLRPLQVATTTISGAKYPTLSMVYPIVSGLLKNHLVVQENDSKTLMQFKEAVTKDLSSRFPSSDEDLCRHPAVISCALDPRYKSLRFLSHEQRESVKENIIQLGDGNGNDAAVMGNKKTQGTDPEPETVTIKQEQGESVVDFKPDVSAMMFLMGDLLDLTDTSVSEECGISSEYEKFLKEPIAVDNDPLVWWCSHILAYPKLGRLSKRFLTIPGTSVPSERVFSDTGNLVTKRRASLDPETVNQLIFLKGILRSNKSENVANCSASAISRVLTSNATCAQSVPLSQENASQPIKMEIDPPLSNSELDTLPPLPKLPGFED